MICSTYTILLKAHCRSLAELMAGGHAVRDQSLLEIFQINDMTKTIEIDDDDEGGRQAPAAAAAEYIYGELTGCAALYAT